MRERTRKPPRMKATWGGFRKRRETASFRRASMAYNYGHYNHKTYHSISEGEVRVRETERLHNAQAQQMHEIALSTYKKDMAEMAAKAIKSSGEALKGLV
jgi:hypothetical protein